MSEKMRRAFLSTLLIGLVLFVSFPLVSAEIFLEQPNTVYSLGDEIVVQATVDEIIDEFFVMELQCKDRKVTIVKDILSSKIVRKQFTLTQSYISSLQGDCSLLTRYGNSSSQSQEFEISDKVDAFLELSSREFFPSEKVVLKLTATKRNNKPLNGFANINFPEGDVSLTKAVRNGTFQTEFLVPSNLASGTYSLKIDVYEKDKKDRITNNVFLENNFVVKQEAKNLELAFINQEAIPGEEFIFKINVYDQINVSMPTQVTYRILNEDGDKLSEKIAESNREITLKVPIIDKPGYRNVIAEVSGTLLTTQRFFYVPEVEKSRFEVLNSTIIVENVGNVPYEKGIEVEFGGETEVLDVELDVGEVARFGLNAPEGEYDIRITDGIDKLSASKIPLTGNAIKIIDSDNVSGSLLNRYPLVWVFIIGVLGLFIYGLTKAFGKEKFQLKTTLASGGGFGIAKLKKKIKSDGVSVSSSNTIPSSGVEVMKAPTPSHPQQTNKQINASVVAGIREGEHSLVLKGKKEEATVISLKIRNQDSVNKNRHDKETINEVLKEITDRRGVIYRIDDYIFGIFSPTITKSFKNELSAISASKEMKRRIEIHNKKFKTQIDFGIGINVGNIIASPDTNTKTLKFTSLGSTISLAKKVSDIANNTFLISEPAHRKTMSTVKVRKGTARNINVFSVDSVTDRADHKKFVKGFLDRQRKESKK